MNADQVRAFVAACYPNAMRSPAALAVQAACLADASAIACDAAAWHADDTAWMLDDARRLADEWCHLGTDGMREQIDAHLESNWPDASEGLREQVVSRACAK